MDDPIPTTSAFDDIEWTMVIRPQRGWWDLRLGELWRYRDLVMLFVRRDFVAQYKQTILTPIVETFRYAYLGAGTVHPWHLLHSAGFMLLVLVAGTLLFNRVEQTFMDTV
jgi:ABC-type polysaccharide/polyol phosphate export permease